MELDRLQFQLLLNADERLVPGPMHKTSVNLLADSISIAQNPLLPTCSSSSK